MGWVSPKLTFAYEARTYATYVRNKIPMSVGAYRRLGVETLKKISGKLDSNACADFPTVVVV